MKNKQETIEKIKQAALEEFYANGYAKKQVLGQSAAGRVLRRIPRAC